MQVHRIPEKREILAYLFPTWEAGLAAMQAIAESDANPSITRVSNEQRDASSRSRRRRRARASRLSLNQGAAEVPEGQGLGPRRRCACRSSATRAATSTSTATRSSSPRSSRSTAASASARAPACSTTRRSSTPRTSATSSSTTAAQPTCPRPPRPGRSCSPLYNDVYAAANRAFDEDRRAGLDHGAPVALVPLGRVPLLHVRVRARRPAARAVRRRQEGDPADAFIDARAARCRTTTVSVSSTPRGSARTSRSPGVALMQGLLDSADPKRNFNPGKVTGK